VALSSAPALDAGPSPRYPAECTAALDPDRPEDSHLLREIRGGDQLSMSLLYHRYSRVVYRVALKMLRDESSAEDVLQEVFMMIWRRPDVVAAEVTCLKGWMTVVGRNRALDVLRKRVKFSSCSCEESVLASPSDYALRLEHQMMTNHAIMIISSLRADTRVLLEMAFYRDLTHRQIAEETGLPLGTIKSKIRKGLLEVRDAFSQPHLLGYKKNQALVNASF